VLSDFLITNSTVSALDRRFKVGSNCIIMLLSAPLDPEITGAIMKYGAVTKMRFFSRYFFTLMSTLIVASIPTLIPTLILVLIPTFVCISCVEEWVIVDIIPGLLSI
jgi:predicted membrane channel-forming protein YqfA (hemolysin III family)